MMTGRRPLLLAAAALLAACAAPPAALPSVPPSGVSAASPSPSASASASPYSAPSDAPAPSPLPSGAAAAPDTGPTPIPGSTPFPTPGPTITPGATRVIGKLVNADGTPAQHVCVVLEKGICPIATDERGIWLTDIPAGPIHWNFIYKVNDQEIGRQFILGSEPGELHLPVYTLTG